jgi:subtilisin-like proprotein convertase family protein
MIVDRAPAVPYPATNFVQNVGGLLTKVSVSILGLNHRFPDDIDILLQGPAGQQATLMSDVGGRDDAVNVNITFDSVSTNPLPDDALLVSGTFFPTNYAGLGTADAFPAPAPPGPYGASDLGVFRGTDPNGTWSLFIVDDTGQDDGNITNGWVIHLESEDPVVPAADLSVAAQLVTSSPLSLGEDQVCVLRVVNNGPSTAHGVVVTEAISGGLQIMSSSTSQGTLGQGGGGSAFQWQVGSLPHGASATATVTARANSAGEATSVVHVRGNQLDMWPSDNTLTMTTMIVEAPVLSVTRLGTQVTVSWPVPDSGYTVESTFNLATPNWLPVTDPVVVFGGRVSLTFNASSQQRFYRLRLH